MSSSKTKPDRNRYLPILLTVLPIEIAIGLILYFPASTYSAIGSLIGGIGSIIAVIWFYTSLRLQSLQLNEQRQQFSYEFQHIREEGRRSALLLVKSILDDTEKQIFKFYPELKSISLLPTLYLDFRDLKPILESTDPMIVKQCTENWIKKEGPAIMLLKGIKSAAEIYFTSTGKKDIDFSKPPEEFIFIYGCWLWNLPFFDIYQGTSTLLSEFLLLTSKGRAAVMLAASVVLYMISPKGIIDEGKVEKDIKLHKQKECCFPKIVEKYIVEKGIVL